MKVQVLAAFSLSRELRGIVNNQLIAFERSHPEVEFSSAQVYLKIKPLKRVAEVMISSSQGILLSKGSEENFVKAMKACVHNIDDQLAQRNSEKVPIMSKNLESDKNHHVH